MVNYFGNARPDFHRFHPSRCGNRHGDDEIPKDLGAARAQLVRLLDVELEVRTALQRAAQMPDAGEAELGLEDVYA